MKKVTLLCVLLACMLVGCGGTGEQSVNQQQQEEEKQLYAENFYYADTANCGTITADANGLLYTATYGNSTQYINIYDLNGTCIGKKSLGVSTGGAQLMEVSEGMLYLLVPELDCMYVLYEIDTTTWQARYVYSFDKYAYVDNLVRIGDYVYVMGRVSNPKSKEYEQYSADVFYMYNGEVISRLSVTTETPELEDLPIDFPVDIFSTANNTLGVYGYTEHSGFVIMEYVPNTGELKEIVQKNGAVYRDFEQCEEGYLFTKNARMHYGTMDGIEAEVVDEGLRSSNIIYNGGFMFLKNYEQEVERIYVNGILKANKTICFLSSSLIAETDTPYGCGYQMEKSVLDAEPFALKVLAQDRDFDVYLLSSREKTSYNLKKNGAFYPLNEVEGVQEYLDGTGYTCYARNCIQ